MKSRFDPRGMRKALQERNTEAQAAAAEFSQQLKDGLLDHTSPTFNQGREAKQRCGLLSDPPVPAELADIAKRMVQSSGDCLPETLVS